MRKTKEEADLTRQTLLSAALKVFSQQGYAATRLEDIAKEAGVTRGAIYHHFGDKAALYNELLTEYSARAAHVIEEAMREGGTLVEMLRRVLVRTWCYLEDDAAYRAVMELTLFKTGIDADLETGLEKKRAGNEATIEQLSTMMQQGIEAGELAADLDPRAAAVAYLAFQNGLASLWLLNPASFSLSQLAERAADTFLRGLRSR